MEVYSRSQKYLLSGYFQVIAKLSFVIAMVFLAASFYFGDESASMANAIDPDPIIMKFSLWLLLIWVLAIFSSFISALGLSCDNCHSKLLGVEHGYKSEAQRNKLVSFFFTDDLFEKKFICFKCRGEFGL